MVEEEPIEFDVTTEQIESALEDFDTGEIYTQYDNLRTAVERVLKAAATEEFYEIKGDYTDRDLPDGTFGTAEVTELFEYARDSREGIRKKGLNQLIEKAGVIHRERDSFKDPDTRYFLTEEFQEAIEGSTGETIDTPEPEDREETEIELSYYDRTLSAGPGEHVELMCRGLDTLVPNLVENTEENAELLYHEIDEDDRLNSVSAGVVEVEIGEERLELREIIPDSIIFDKQEETLMIFEASLSRGVVDEERVANIVEAVEDQIEDIDLGITFFTLFSTEKEFGSRADDIADDTYVWIAAEPEFIRSLRKNDLSEISSLHRHTA